MLTVLSFPSSIDGFDVSELDPKSLSPVHGLHEFDELVRFWESNACLRMQNATRPPWENYLIGLGISAVRSTRSLSVLANTRTTEGMQCIARNIVELVSKAIDLIVSRDKACAYFLKEDGKQRRKIARSESEIGRNWLSAFTDVAPEPDGATEFVRTPDCQNIQMKAEYQYLCHSAHNHLNALKRKLPNHWSTYEGEAVVSAYEPNLLLRGHAIDPFGREPAVDVERYLHICVIAMEKLLTKILESRELFLDPETVADHIKSGHKARIDSFLKACPRR
jgi:hypothetical protein